MNLMVIGIIAFLVPTIIARFVSEKGMKALTDEQRGQLLAAFSKTRKWSVIILSVIMLTFLYVAYNFHVDEKLAVYSYFGAILLYMLVVNGANLMKVRNMGFPQAFLRANFMASILRLLGLIILLVCLAGFLVQNISSLEKAA